VATSLSERLVSLDAFRGFTIAAMVLVNNPGDWAHIYGPLAHAPWHGWTFTDWIFPFFLFIVGVSMVFSLSRSALGEQQRLGAMLVVWRRAAIIFLIGLALNFVPAFDVSTVRIPGVLQRIALCIVIAAPILVYFKWRGWLAAIVLLSAAYAVPMLAFNVQGADSIVAAGRLEPGMDFGAAVDRALLPGHLWAAAKTWDPEGLFSTLSAATTLLFGALTGRWLLHSAVLAANRTVWMLLVGLLALWLGTSLDKVMMPINKPLWTVSYSVFMSGWALLVFSAFYWLMDACDHTRITARARQWCLPLTIYGMNALFIFALSGLIGRLINTIKIGDAQGAQITLKAALYAPLQTLPLAPINSSLLFAIAFNLAMFAVAWVMWKKRWFVKV
jgi:predicted acyltransferase